MLFDIKDMFIEVDGKQQNFCWVESEMDELDINIVFQQIELVVVCIEKLKSLVLGLCKNVIVYDFIIFKVEERCVKLVVLIVCEFIFMYYYQWKIKQNVFWLMCFGFEDCVREVYLEVCSEII